MLSGGDEPQQLFFFNVFLEFNTVFHLQFQDTFDSEK